MKMTIREVMTKLKDIEYAIDSVRKHTDQNCFDMADVEDLLQEYATKIKDTQVDI